MPQGRRDPDHNCVTPPTKDVILAILLLKCQEKKLNLAWIDEARMPDKKWMVNVLATLDPSNEIFAKDYVAHPHLQEAQRHRDDRTNPKTPFPIKV